MWLREKKKSSLLFFLCFFGFLDFVGGTFYTTALMVRGLTGGVSSGVLGKGMNVSVSTKSITLLVASLLVGDSRNRGNICRASDIISACVIDDVGLLDDVVLLDDGAHRMVLLCSPRLDRQIAHFLFAL